MSGSNSGLITDPESYFDETPDGRQQGRDGARGRPHRATVWGGLLIIVSHPLRLLIGTTQAWLTFATWLTGWGE